MSFRLLLSIVLAIHVTEATLLPNSCVGQEDGDYWLQLDVSNNDVMMPLNLECSNEYVMLDYSKDPNLSNYFSSWQKWHYAVAGPANHDTVNWQEWFLPSFNNGNPNDKFVISPNCDSCDETHSRQIKNSKTTYWMNGALNKLFWGVIGTECDVDYDSYQCFNCQTCIDEAHSSSCNPVAYTETDTDYANSGLCPFTVQSSLTNVAQERRIAQNSHSVDLVGLNYKPSIGMDHRFCVCYQPSDENAAIAKYELTTKQKEYYLEQLNMKAEKDKETETETQRIDDQSSIMAQSLLKEKDVPSSKLQKIGTNAIDESFDKRDSNVIYLSQNDFKDGTYRLTKSGTYILTCDIEFDFNSELNHWPRKEQSDDYAGADSYRDAYHLGFFAGIAIETDFVTIDLNGFEMRQSLAFYYKQRWFSIIELGNQHFMAGQGPAFFGSDYVSVSNINIINGKLGRTSHFAIHGNYPTNLKIENVHIKDFVTHGMQLNGWYGLRMNNVEIGPSSSIEYLRGDFGQARLWSMRLKKIEMQMENENKQDKTIKFDNRDESVTIRDIINELDYQLDLAFEYAMNRANNKYTVETDYLDASKYNEIQSNDELAMEWEKTKLQFIHESGLPSSSSISGIFLNGEGSSVFSYQMNSDRRSKHGKLSNIYIHDIYHDMYEVLRFTKYSEKGQYYASPLNSDYPAESAFGSKENVELFAKTVGVDGTYKGVNYQDIKYNGLIMADVLLAMGTFSDDWDLLGFLLIDRIYENDLQDWAFGDSSASYDWKFTCNQDAMGHAGKGLLGLRLDAIDSIEIENIKIENLYEKTQLGNEACGKYISFEAGTGAHFKQLLPMQYGFSGNNLQAISIISSKNVNIKGNVIVNNINSDYGEGSGISLWTNNNVNFDENSFVKITNVNTGLELEHGTLNYHSAPNRSPEACAVRLQIDSKNEYPSTIAFNNENENDNVNGEYSIISCNIAGHEKCLGENELGNTMYGSYLSDDGNICNLIESKQDLINYLNNDDTIDKLKNIEIAGIKFQSRQLINNVKFGMIGLLSTFLTIFVLYGLYYHCFVKKLSKHEKEMLMTENKFSDNFNYGSIRVV